MSIDSKISEYESAILSAAPQRVEAVMGKVADRFEDDLLEMNEFSAEYFRFILRLLSEEKFHRLPGVWNFLLVLGTEKEKLKVDLRQQLSDCLLENYSNYKDPDLCLAVCDFVARNYSHDAAKALLKRFEVIERKKNLDLQGFARDGLRIADAELSRQDRNG